MTEVFFSVKVFGRLFVTMKLGMQIDLGPGHIVLDGDPAPLSQRGTAQPPIFGPYLL